MQRLRRSGEFTAAVRSGRRAGRGAIVVHLAVAEAAAPFRHERQSVHQLSAASMKPVRPGGGDHISTPARAGFIVSKAVGPAVVRNRVRRRLRHLVREHLNALPPGAILVVRALPATANLSYARLAADLEAAIAAVREPRELARRSR